MGNWGPQFSIIYNILTSGLITNSGIYQDVRYLPLLHSVPRTEGIHGTKRETGKNTDNTVPG